MKYGAWIAMATIQVDAIKRRRVLTVMRRALNGYKNARKRSTAIITRLWLDTEIDVSLKNVHILHKIVPPNPCTVQADDSVTANVIKRGSKKIAVKRSEAAMLVIRSISGFFICVKATTRKLFPTRATRRARTFIKISISFENSKEQLLFPASSWWEEEFAVCHIVRVDQFLSSD